MQNKKDKNPKEEPLQGIEPEKEFLDELRKKSAEEGKVKGVCYQF
jgi:hypothetical protein